tara:strand:- start:3 stop:467 length:465 start_codon:yes stop_codon:yes gene_type:complete
MPEKISITMHEDEHVAERMHDCHEDMDGIHGKFVAAEGNDSSVHCLVGMEFRLDPDQLLSHTHLMRELLNRVREADLDVRSSDIPPEYHGVLRGGGRMLSTHEAPTEITTDFGSDGLRLEVCGGSDTPDDPGMQKAILDAVQEWTREKVAELYK